MYYNGINEKYYNRNIITMPSIMYQFSSKRIFNFLSIYVDLLIIKHLIFFYRINRSRICHSHVVFHIHLALMNKVERQIYLVKRLVFVFTFFLPKIYCMLKDVFILVFTAFFSGFKPLFVNNYNNTNFVKLSVQMVQLPIS
jgi:hypothetical protein